MVSVAPLVILVLMMGLLRVSAFGTSESGVLKVVVCIVGPLTPSDKQLLIWDCQGWGRLRSLAAPPLESGGKLLPRARNATTCSCQKNIINKLIRIIKIILPKVFGKVRAFTGNKRK